jgi:hypothetical protein
MPAILAILASVTRIEARARRGQAIWQNFVLKKSYQQDLVLSLLQYNLVLAQGQ